MMITGAPLRALIVEDSADDAALVLRELRKCGYEPVSERVESEAAMRAALREKPWDIILSDYMMPGFGGMEALKIAKEDGLDVPFVIVSGKVGEETLAEVMKAGASDFLIKGSLRRLGTVVRRELADAAARRGMRQAQIEWRTAFDSVRDAVFFHDYDYRILRANLAYAALAGMPIQEVIGKRYWEVFPKRDGPLPGCRAITERREGWDEEEFALPTGEAYSSRSFAVAGERGEYLYSFHVLQDVTERNRVREAMEASEHRFRSLIENASDLLVVLDTNGIVTYVSPSIRQISGHKVEEILGKSYLDFMHPEDVETARSGLAELLRNPRTARTSEYRFRRKDGEWGYLQAVTRNSLADPAVGGIVINARDVTERKRAQEALEHSERYYRKLIEGGTDAFLVVDRTGKICYRSESGKQITGHDWSDVVGKPITDMIAPESLSAAREAFARRIKNPGTVGRVELRILRKDGPSVEVEAMGRNLLDDPDIGGIVLTLHDIAERKRAEQALNRLNRALRTLSSCNEALVRATDEVQLLNEMCRIAVEIGGYRMAWVGFAEYGAEKAVRPVARSGAEQTYLERANISWADNERGRGPTGSAIREGKFSLIADAAADPRFAPWRTEAIKRGYQSVLALPLLARGNAFGAFTIYSEERNAFDEDAVKLLNELAGDLAFGIVTLRTRAAQERGAAQLQRSLQETIQGIAATVERRDPYTAGHQRRVAELAGAIATDLGLPEEQRRGLHLAAVVHDVGKIQIPAEILTKPGKLTDAEFRVIMAHAQSGYEILKDVDFPWPIAEIVRQHHERQDGSGYPRKLKADDILIEARILAVADTVEAMASPRPYRPAPGIELALKEITERRGSKYDAAAVDACLRLFREKAFAFTGSSR